MMSSLTDTTVDDKKATECRALQRCEQSFSANNTYTQQRNPPPVKLFQVLMITMMLVMMLVRMLRMMRIMMMMMMLPVRNTMKKLDNSQNTKSS